MAQLVRASVRACAVRNVRGSSYGLLEAFTLYLYSMLRVHSFILYHSPTYKPLFVLRDGQDEERKAGFVRWFVFVNVYSDPSLEIRLLANQFCFRSLSTRGVSQEGGGGSVT